MQRTVPAPRWPGRGGGGARPGRACAATRSPNLAGHGPPGQDVREAGSGVDPPPHGHDTSGTRPHGVLPRRRAGPGSARRDPGDRARRRRGGSKRLARRLPHARRRRAARRRVDGAGDPRRHPTGPAAGRRVGARRPRRRARLRAVARRSRGLVRGRAAARRRRRRRTRPHRARHGGDDARVPARHDRRSFGARCGPCDGRADDGRRPGTSSCWPGTRPAGSPCCGRTSWRATSTARASTFASPSRCRPSPTSPSRWPTSRRPAGSARTPSSSPGRGRASRTCMRPTS